MVRKNFSFLLLFLFLNVSSLFSFSSSSSTTTTTITTPSSNVWSPLSGTPSPCTAYGNVTTDWLVTSCPVKSTFQILNTSSSNVFLLYNGIVSRTFTYDTLSRQLYTSSLRSEASGQEKLSAVVPETVMEINGQLVYVGGNNTEGIRFTYNGFRTSTNTVAGNFTYTPGSRSSRNRPWPPSGIRVEMDHTLSCSVIFRNNTDPNVINVTVVYELYDDTSTFSKRILLNHNCSSGSLYVFNMSISLYSLKRVDSVNYYTDASIAETTIVTIDTVPYVIVNRFIPITANHRYDNDIPTYGPGLSNFLPTDQFISYMTMEVIHDAYSPGPNDQRGMSWYGLESSRGWRTLAPQTEQFPIIGNVMCIGGYGTLPSNDPRIGSWCYDDVGTAGIQTYIQQATVIGVEGIDISLNMNNTWRSQIGVEFQSQENITWFKALVDQAKTSNIEVGVYQLLRNARSATGINECAPNNAINLANVGYDDMDLLPPYGTGLPCHNGGNAQCEGGPGCCSTCSASEWFDEMMDTVFAFWDATGITITEQDGAESDSPCANVSHIHHHGLNDSVWMKWNKAHDVFRGYLDRGGFIQGMPGHWLEGGQSKVPGGYDEMTWSLPRWTWIHRQRERMIHDPQYRDQSQPNALRYFVIPFTPYHPQQVLPNNPANWSPVVGLESTATLEPLENHTVELEWALSQTFGTGIFTNMRGYRLYGGPLSQAIMMKWINFAKTYRQILVTDFVTLQCGTTCWGSGQTFPNGTCTVTSWDGILHRAPVSYYPDITERGLAMIWNPLDTVLTNVNITLPLYYAGLTPYSSIKVRQEEGTSTVYTLDGNSTFILPNLTLPSLTVTYFVIETAN